MKLASNPFTRAIQTGEKQIGLWLSLSNNFSAEVVASSGFDWVLVDMEHSPNDISSVLSQLQVFAAYSTTAIVRPQWNDPVMVKRLLDIGANGLLFPMIQMVEEAEKAVASTRYPPRGIRGVSGSTRANAFGRVNNYFDEIENQTSIIVQIETLCAIEQAQRIAKVDGVHGVFFGPADIAADIGKVGKPMDEEVWKIIRPAARRLIDQGVAVGTLVFDPEFAVQLLNEGFTFVACGSDTNLLSKGADSLLKTVKAAI